MRSLRRDINAPGTTHASEASAQEIAKIMAITMLALCLQKPSIVGKFYTTSTRSEYESMPTLRFYMIFLRGHGSLQARESILHSALEYAQYRRFR